MDIAKILPLAFVMVAGPQIISAFFFATSESWKKVSGAYVLGAAISITAVVSAAYFLSKGAGGGGDDGSSGSDAIDYAVVALLIFAAIHTFRGRHQSEPPKWMGKLQAATPKATFVLGFLLLGFFPSDLVTSISVGSFLGNHGDPWWDVLPFVLFTLLLLGLPALLVVALGSRAQVFLPKVRDWMNANSWIISEVVIVFFIVIVLSG
ncbi:MAG TPA: GAP family protein [Solirubrobacterales bacterium]|nr:GAP family protein [Solirubrobacterales bacterium]